MLVGGLNVGFWANKNDAQICAEMANSQELGESYWNTQPEHCANMIQRNEESIRTLIETVVLVYAVLLPLLWDFRQRIFGDNNKEFFVSLPFLQRSRNGKAQQSGRTEQNTANHQQGNRNSGGGGGGGGGDGSKSTCKKDGCNNACKQDDTSGFCKKHQQ